MTTDIHRPEKDEIACEILAYLCDHPDAEDTLDGIVQWWLLDREIKHQSAMVKEALNDLVKCGLIRGQDRQNSRICYRINEDRFGDIWALLKRRER